MSIVLGISPDGFWSSLGLSFIILFYVSLRSGTSLLLSCSFPDRSIALWCYCYIYLPSPWSTYYLQSQIVTLFVGCYHDLCDAIGF